jgi:hypothetical protein
MLQTPRLTLFLALVRLLRSILYLLVLVGSAVFVAFAVFCVLFLVVFLPLLCLVLQGGSGFAVLYFDGCFCEVVLGPLLR